MRIQAAKRQPRWRLAYTWNRTYCVYPFIHIGHFEIGTFGLLLWLAAVSGCWVLYKNFQRKGIEADAINITALATVAGIVGAKLWHVFESPPLAHADSLAIAAGPGRFCVVRRTGWGDTCPDVAG